eukprot:m.74235 g.74235  ORF g.74235 m.74235 type:complete len:70 (-) comp24638_c0_seq2:31-240(-)
MHADNMRTTSKDEANRTTTHSTSTQTNHPNPTQKNPNYNYNKFTTDMIFFLEKKNINREYKSSVEEQNT